MSRRAFWRSPWRALLSADCGGAGALRFAPPLRGTWTRCAPGDKHVAGQSRVDTCLYVRAGTPLLTREWLPMCGSGIDYERRQRPTSAVHPASRDHSDSPPVVGRGFRMSGRGLQGHKYPACSARRRAPSLPSYGGGVRRGDYALVSLLRVGDHRAVPAGDLDRVGSHPLCKLLLGIGRNHLVVLGDQIPRRQ